jgi:hypothetical protein
MEHHPDSELKKFVSPICHAPRRLSGERAKAKKSARFREFHRLYSKTPAFAHCP